MQNINKPIFRNLCSLMAENRYTYQNIAEYLGISVKTVNDKFNFKREFKMSEMTKIVELFNKKNTRGFQLTMDYIFFTQE